MKTSEKLIVAAASAMLGTAGAYCGISKMMTDNCMNRETPALMRCMQRKMVKGGDSAAAEDDGIAREAERLRTLPLELVHITARDSVPLTGHWRPVLHPKRIIIAMHGWRGAWYRDFAGIADFWNANGCSVLFAEQRAHGLSGGEYLSFGILERWDCLDWASWAAEHCPDPDIPIYLAGISMGATTVLLAVGETPLPERIRGVMADCGFTSMDDICAHVCRRDFHLPYALFRPLTGYLCRRRIGYKPDAISTPEALAKTALPVLLVHGLADSFVPPEMSEKNMEALGDRGTLLLVPGASHGTSCLTDRTAYETAVLEFWNRCEK